MTWIMARIVRAGLFGSLLLGAMFGISCTDPQRVSLLNVSFDPTREFFGEINAAFQKNWTATNATTLRIQQSHGGSAKQARAVIDGLDADVVTLALGHDIDRIAAETGILPRDWQQRLPNRSTPYTSTVVFMVRKGNPKRILNWPDLVRSGVQVITPNPKSSGGARWNYLAAYGWARRQPGGDDRSAREFVARIFRNVPVLDSGARGATVTFLQRGIGDVLLTWESEAHQALSHAEGLSGEIVTPSESIVAEPPVAVIDRNARKHGVLPLAECYLRFLYTEEAQMIAARHHFRPQLENAAMKAGVHFPPIVRFSLAEICGDWQAAHAAHFATGGWFDQIQSQRKP